MQPSPRDRTIGAVLAALLCATGCRDAVTEPALPSARLVVPDLWIESCDLDADGLYFIAKGRIERLDRSTGQVDELTSDVGGGTHRLFHQPGRTVWTEDWGVYALADGAHVRTTLQQENNRRSIFVAAVRSGPRVCWAHRGMTQQIECLGPGDSTPSTVRSGPDVDGRFASANDHLYTIRLSFDDRRWPMDPKNSHVVRTLFEVPLSDGDAVRIGEVPADSDVVATRSGLAWLTLWGGAQVLEGGRVRSIEPTVLGGWRRAWANGGHLWLLDAYGWSVEESIGHLRRVLNEREHAAHICADDLSLYATTDAGIVEVRLDGSGS